MTLKSVLRTRSKRLSHMEISSGLSLSTLADANKNRDWIIYADFAQSLIRKARGFYLDEITADSISRTQFMLWIPLHKGGRLISPFAFGPFVLGLPATLFQRYRSQVVQAAVNEPVRHVYQCYVHAQSKRRSSSPRMFRTRLRPSARRHCRRLPGR